MLKYFQSNTALQRIELYSNYLWKVVKSLLSQLRHEVSRGDVDGLHYNWYNCTMCNTIVRNIWNPFSMIQGFCFSINQLGFSAKEKASLRQHLNWKGCLTRSVWASWIQPIHNLNHTLNPSIRLHSSCMDFKLENKWDPIWLFFSI